MTIAKTVPMLTLAASLSAALMMSASNSAFARHNHHGNNNGGNNSFNNNRNGGNNNFNNNNRNNNNSFSNNGGNNGGKFKFEKKDRSKSSDKKKKDQNQAGTGTTQGTSTMRSGATVNQNPQQANTTVQGTTSQSSSSTAPQSAGAGTPGNCGFACGSVTSPGTTPKPGATGNTVIISNGVRKIEMQNGPGGVAVSTDGSGKITVTNGKETQTLNGGSITLSGNVIGIGAAQGLQVGKRNSEGNVPIAIQGGGSGGHFNGNGTPYGNPSPAPTSGTPPSAPSGTIVRDHRHDTSGTVSNNAASDWKDAGKKAGRDAALIVSAPFAVAGGVLHTTGAGVYGLVSGGVPGAINQVKSTGKSAWNTIKSAFNRWW